MSEFIRSQVSEQVEHAVSQIRSEDGQLATGNILRRTCDFGGAACQQVCQLQEERELFNKGTAARELVAEALSNRSCSDINLLRAIERLGLEPSDVLMVGVTANNVGFADKINEYETLADNPYGWRELPGFNAFFARAGEVGALGRRLADCADVNFEFKDESGKTVFGFEHGTRTDMFGPSDYPFEIDGKKVSFTEHVLGLAIDHYGAEPASIKIKLAAAIKAHNFVKHFDSVQAMEEHIPGWWRAGYAENITNPDWRADAGGGLSLSDTWEADSRGMIVDDIQRAMRVYGIPAKNFSTKGIIDPADSQGVHSSHEFREQYGDTRDLYITFPKQ